MEKQSELSETAELRLHPTERSRILEQFLHMLKIKPEPYFLDSASRDGSRLSFSLDLNVVQGVFAQMSDECDVGDWGIEVCFVNNETVESLDGDLGLIDHCAGIEFHNWTDIDDDDPASLYVPVPGFYCRRVLPGEWDIEHVINQGAKATDPAVVDQVLIELARS